MTHFMVDQKRPNTRRSYVEWLGTLTPREWRRKHGYDPLLPKGHMLSGVVRDRFQEVK